MPGAHDGIEGLEHLDKVIDIDQSPIGRTPRSNPATYIKLFDQIRDLYTQLPEAKVTRILAGPIQLQCGGGRCEACDGNGSNRLEMDFLADVWVTCPVCQGKRFGRETLHVRFKGKSISDVLNMDVQEALEHFANIPKIAGMLQTLHDVGLDYIKLGQPSPTLSGGEAQRIKLARELVKKGTGKTLYILDEPTTGLHFDDVRKLLDVLHGFTALGNTVVVIEHNLDVVKTADWIIDLGPDGGAEGGWIVAQGPPEEVVEVDASYTAQALRKVLSRRTALQAEAGGPTSTKSKVKLSDRPSAAQTAADRFMTAIEVRGARQHNLKGIDLDIPRNKMTVCSGPSGSGKSSLAIDTLYAEGQRRYVESLRAMPGSSWLRCKSPRLSGSPGCRRRSASSRKRPARARARRWGRSPRFTTTCGSCLPGWGIRSAPSAACRSAPRRPTRSSRRCFICRRVPRSSSWRRLNGATASAMRRSGTSCGPRDLRGSGSTASRSAWTRRPS